LLAFYGKEPSFVLAAPDSATQITARPDSKFDLSAAPAALKVSRRLFLSRGEFYWGYWSLFPLFFFPRTRAIILAIGISLQEREIIYAVCEEFKTPLCRLFCPIGRFLYIFAYI